MAVGTLNVAVTATTGQATTAINGLRTTVKGLETTVAGTKRTLGSLTIPEIGRTFYFPKEEMRGAIRDAELFRSATVDLSADVSRYNGLALKQTGLITGLSRELKVATKAAMGAAKVAAASAAVFAVFFTAAKYVSEYAHGIRSLGDDLTWLKGKASDAMESLFDPRLHDVKAQKAAARAAGIEAAKEKAKAEAEARAKLDAEFASRVREGGMDLMEARGLNVDRQYDKDRAQFGQGKAIERMRSREAIAEAEAATEAKKVANEKRREAIAEQNRKYEEAAERRRKNQAEDERAIADLRRDVAEFWLSDVVRERNALLRTLEDPRLRREANGLFMVQDAQQAAQRDAERRKNMRSLLSESGSQSLSATGADSREGFAQRVRFQNSGSVNKIAEKQLKEQERTRVAVEKIASRNVADISLANFAGG